ncbi:MAG: EamA family transporter [Anaerolineales bacterium]
MKTKIWIALLAVHIIWGSTYLGIRFAIETIPPFLQAGVRFFVSGLILLVWRWQAGDARPTRRQWISAGVVGTLLLVGGNGLISYAEQTVPSGIAALLVATIPLWMVLIEAMRPGGVRPVMLQVLGLLLGFAGIGILVGPSELLPGNATFDLAGVLLCLSAAFLWSLGSIFSRNADVPHSTFLFTGMQMLVGSLGLLLVSAALGEFGRFDPGGVSLRSLGGLVYLITFGSLGGFVAYGWLLKNAPISLVSTYAYVNPIVAVFLGNLLAQEPLNGRILAATGIIIGSIALINQRGSTRH